MGEETDRLIELIELVADGNPGVDWDALEQNAADESLRAALRELRTIYGVSAVHASRIAEISDTPPSALTSTRATASVSIGGTRAGRHAADPSTVTSEVPPAAGWGNFRLVRKVGEGSYGEVFEAIDTFLDHRVALKLLKPVVADRARILQEARLLVRLRHPNVVAVHGADAHGGRIGFWMDFVEGATLAEVVAREDVRSAEEAVAIGQHLCRAVAAVHAVGIVHRDIKAQNVMRESGTGRIVLMDFGAGERLTSAQPVLLRTVGTPLYLAPEVIAGAAATKQSDIYALGVLLFYLVTGTFPVQGASIEDLRSAHARGVRRRLADVRPDLPDGFIDVVEKMLAPASADRFESAAAVRAALSGAVEMTAPVIVKRELQAASVASRIGAATAGMVSALAFVTVSGLISTAAYNLTFGRSGEFGVESPLRWFATGVQSLVSPVVRIGAGVVVLAAIIAAFKLCCRLSRGTAAHVARWNAACGAFARTRQLDDPTLLLELVIGIGVAMFAALTWTFWSEVTAPLILLNDAPAARIAALYQGDRFSHLGRVLEACLFLYGVAVYVVLKMATRSGHRIERPVIALASAVPLLVFLLLRAVPYRIEFQDDLMRVDVEDARCYQIGQTERELLLHCPDAPAPRNVVVDTADPRLHRTGVIESVFTPRALAFVRK